MEMKEQKKKKYETLSTKVSQVEMEEGFMAGSKQHVVVDNKNTTVDIDRQKEGGDFELDTWN